MAIGNRAKASFASNSRERKEEPKQEKREFKKDQLVAAGLHENKLSGIWATLERADACVLIQYYKEKERLKSTEGLKVLDEKWSNKQALHEV